MNDAPVYKRSFEFALKIIPLYQRSVSHKEYVISKQLLRCGTSIGANINEAPVERSKRDLIAKMSIASKEARETLYRSKFLQASKLAEIDLTQYIFNCEERIRILTAIAKTAQLKEAN